MVYDLWYFTTSVRTSLILIYWIQNWGNNSMSLVNHFNLLEKKYKFSWSKLVLFTFICWIMKIGLQKSHNVELPNSHIFERPKKQSLFGYVWLFGYFVTNGYFQYFSSKVSILVSGFDLFYTSENWGANISRKASNRVLY